MTSELNRTNSTVTSMSNDISRLNQNISRNGEASEKLLNDILKESKATKYATEAMQSQMDYIYRTDYLHLI